MNATQQEMMMYLQTQMVAAMQQRPTTAKSQTKDGPSFQDMMNKRAQDAPKDEAPPKTENSKPTDKTEAPADPGQAPVLDPYRQQLLAAAQAAAAATTIQIVDTAPQQTNQPVVQTVQIAAPIQPQMETPQVPVTQAPVLSQQSAAQPVQPQVVQPQVVQPQQSQQTQPMETAVQTQVKPQAQTRPTTPRQEAHAQGADTAQTKVEQPLEAVRVQPKGEVTDAQQTELKPQETETPAARPQAKSDQVVTAHTQGEAPVFAKVETTPIKVGEAPMLDTETGDVDVQLAKQVDGLLQKGGDRVELRLNPEHLGAVTVQLTRSEDGSIHVAINATSNKATELLERHATGLEQLLAGTSRGPVQVEVQRSQDSQHAGQQQQPQERENSAGQQQQQQRQPQREQNRTQDFMQQLRLGLVGVDEAAS